MNHFYSNLKLMLIALLACVGVSAWAADPDVTLDFTSQDNWDIPTSGTNTTEATFTDGTYSIKLYAATNYKLNSGYLLLGKSGSYLELPAFTFDVEKIEITGTSGASTSVIQNIYVGDVAVSTATTGAKDVTNTYAIAENYQAAGTIYTLKVTSSHNTQISTIKIYKKSAGQEDNRTATTVELTAGHATSGEVGATIDLPTAIVKAGDATVDGASITWSSSKENVATIADGKINLVAAGSTTIKATYAGDDTYKGSSASYTLTVTATSLKALQEAVTSTSTPVTIQFNNVFVTAVKGSNAYLADADGYGALVYTSNHGLEAGQVLNGTINANFMLYKGQTEITNFTTEGLTITTEELVPTVKTIDAITAANQSTLVTLKNVTYADGKLSDGTNEITYYDTFSAGTPEENKTYDITGIVILFNSTIEFSPRSASDIVEAAEITTYNVTIVDGVNAPYDTYGTRNNGVSPMTFTSNNASGVGGVQVKVAKIDRHSSWWNVYSMVIQPSTVQSDEEIIITAPNGYLIEGYSINFVSVSSSCLYDVKLPGQEVSEVSTTGDIYTVSGLADKSSSITFKAKGSSVNYLGMKSFTVTLIDDPSYVTYTCNLKIGNDVIAIESAKALLGDAPVAPTSFSNSYVTALTPDVETITADGQEVNFTPTFAELPFTVSTSFENAVWYYMNGHASYNDKYISTNGDATVWDTGKEEIAAYQWAFIGTPYGIKLINRAAGAEKFLQATNPATMGSDAKAWVLKKQTNTSYESGDKGFGLWDATLTYLNTQSSTLKYYAYFDQGSTYWVEAVPTYAITIADGIENGEVTVNKSAVYAGETVTLTITPAEDYQLESLSVTDGETPVALGEGNTFVMPAAPVTVTATFSLAPATDEDYAALNTAIASYPLGFEAGEYAPYNNIEALATITAAKAIDQTAENTQKDVKAATAAITTAAWQVNAAEVNAIFDGTFEYAYSTSSGNIQPIGWHGVGDKDNATNVRWQWDETSNAGLNATSSTNALFMKFTALYGTETGYTLPLKAGYYTLKFVYGGWNETGERIIQVYDGDTKATVNPSNVKAKDNQAHTTASSWDNYSGIIYVPADGNYILSFYRQNTNSQNQLVLGDIEFFRATAEDIKPLLSAEIASASAIDVTTNVGTAAFQIPAASAEALTTMITTAQGAYDNTEATAESLTTALTNLQAAEEAFANVELNAPAAGKVYNVINVTSGYAYSGNALTFLAASDADLTGNTTKMQWYAAPGSIYPQGVKFTAVDGVLNGYKMSYTRADGTEVYVATGSGSGLGQNTAQIRPTTDAAKALTVVITSAGDNKWYLLNTEDNHSIGATADNGFYTNGGANKDVLIQEALNNEVALSIAAENQYGTIILPFAAAIPAGVKAYGVSEVNGEKLSLVEKDAFEANTPYIVFAEVGIGVTLAGLGAAYTNTSYTEGLLTGVYADTDAPNGSYILQNHEGKVAFYLVDTSVKEPKVKANHAYLTYNGGGEGVKAFYLGGDVATAIERVMTSAAAGEIFDLAGRKVSRMVKGNTYIVGGQKVMVK